MVFFYCPKPKRRYGPKTAKSAAKTTRAKEIIGKELYKMWMESEIRKLMERGLSLQRAAQEAVIKERRERTQTPEERKPQPDSTAASRPQWSFLDEGINPNQVKFDMATGRIMVRNKTNTDAAEVQRLLWDDKRQNIIGYQRKGADPVYFKDVPKSAPKAPGRDPGSGPVAPSGVAYPQSTAASYIKIEAPETDVQIMQRLSQKYPAYQTDAQQAQQYAKEYGEAHAASENRQKIIDAMPKVITEEYKAAAKKLVNQYADYLDGKRKPKNGAGRDDRVVLLGLLEKSGYDANKFADMAVAMGYKELDKNNDLQAILFGLAEGFNNAFVHWRQQIQTAGYNPHPYAQEIETIGKAQSESPFGSPDAVPILQEYSDSLGKLSEEKYAPVFRNIQAENQAMSDASHPIRKRSQGLYRKAHRRNDSGLYRHQSADRGHAGPGRNGDSRRLYRGGVNAARAAWHCAGCRDGYSRGGSGAAVPRHCRRARPDR